MKAIQKLQEEIKKLNVKLEKAKGKQKLECLHCHKKTEIGKLTVMTEQYYSAFDGEWMTSGDYYVKCPHCNKESRYYGASVADSHPEDKIYQLAKFVDKNYFSFGDTKSREK